jgi:hypothetical protein
MVGKINIKGAQALNPKSRDISKIGAELNLKK